MSEDLPIYYDHSYSVYESECPIKDTRFQPRGAIFIEADVKTTDDDWQPAIDEYKMVAVESTANQGLVGIIPWAPLNLGRSDLEKFHLEILAAGTPHSNSLVKGYRYLLQDKPDGAMLDEKFIDALNWLGEKGLVFDLGIDFHRRGAKQLNEFITLLGKCHNVRFMMNHFAKPDIGREESFEEWRILMMRIIEASENSSNELYFKFSGLFEEFGNVENVDDITIINKSIPYFRFLLKAVDTKKLLWASDWPVCSMVSGKAAFKRWSDITERIFDILGVEDDIRESIYGENALNGYNIK
ncbi:DEKNAAC103957 [Brettanomyces naardenensis]|uniref:DEKNAAC103957 n=1 Tax=Brettanomyces naardenensis TaxID=13370 RepID=A0A448YPQ6_BRENA|nr:DEKNAAC103957 [Brettanomyces naardenensis]